VLPPGYVARPLEFIEVDDYLDGPDVDLAYSVVSAADSGVLAIAEASRESVRSDLVNPDTVLDEHRLILDNAGVAVGLLIVERDEAARSFFIDAYAVPAHGPQLLPPLIAMGISVAERLKGEGEWQVECGAFAQDEVYLDALHSAGFAEVRRFWHMHIEVDSGYAKDPPPAPPGVTRTTAETESDRRLIHRLDQEAFAEHFGFVPKSYDEWMPWLSDRRDARPDTWWIAWLDGEPVGLCMQDDSRIERDAGHVRILGVLPRARGRGIATWLLRSAFAQAAREGRTAMTLTVDSDNTTGATALYERAGMKPERVIRLLRRPLP
jgi:ribosomal protein S18 acetylase RimI-like enzyme